MDIICFWPRAMVQIWSSSQANDDVVIWMKTLEEAWIKSRKLYGRSMITHEPLSVGLKNNLYELNVHFVMRCVLRYKESTVLDIYLSFVPKHGEITNKWLCWMHNIYDFLLIELILYFYLKLTSFFNFSSKEKLNKNISTSTKNLKKYYNYLCGVLCLCS